MALEPYVQACNKGCDPAHEGNEIIREASKWSPILGNYGNRSNLSLKQSIPCPEPMNWAGNIRRESIFTIPILHIWK